MGNVLAATHDPLQFKHSSPAVETLDPPPIQKNIPEKSFDEFKFNPGTFEDIHRKCKEVFPMTFEGVRLMINKGLSNHFQVSHTLSISNLASGYRFGATYVGNQQYSLMEAYPVLLGDMDANGNLNAQVIHQPTSNIRYKFISQIQNNKFLANQFTVDYRSPLYTATLTLSPNISPQTLFNDSNSPSSKGLPSLSHFLSNLGTGILVAQYLHNVTPCLALGTELMYHKSPQQGSKSGQDAFLSFLGPVSMPKHNAIMTVGAKYTGSDFVASATFGSAGWKAAYWQNLDASRLIPVSSGKSNIFKAPPIASPYLVDSKKNDDTPSMGSWDRSSIQIGCEVETNPTFGESVAMFGYQVTLKEPPATNLLAAASPFGAPPPGAPAPFTFRGYVDTNGTLGATLEKRLAPLPLTFTLSGALNHAKGSACKFGIGLMLG